VLSRGIKIPYVPEKQSAAAEIERQLRRLVVFPRQRPPSEHATAAPRCPCERRLPGLVVLVVYDSDFTAGLQVTHPAWACHGGLLLEITHSPLRGYNL
jgi:hypothetical protein